MASFSESEADVHESPWHADSTMLQSARCCLFKGDRMPVTMTQAPSRKPIVEDDMTSQPLVLHWRYNSLRGPVHQTFPDVLMSSQVNWSENSRLVQNCTWFFTDVTAAIVVQSTFTSGLADVFNSSQALQATPETQAPIRLPREEPVVEKRQTRSKLHLVFHWCHCSLRGPVDNHK